MTAAVGTQGAKGRNMKRILAISAGAMYVSYLLFLGIMTGVDTMYTQKLSVDTDILTQELDALYNRNAEFALYLENKAFLDGMTVPSFSTYLAELNTKIPEGTRTQSIQVSKSTIEKEDTYILSLVLESIPPLREIGRVIDTLESGDYFQDVSIASASVNTDTAGSSTFSYPISMTINTNPVAK